MKWIKAAGAVAAVALLVGVFRGVDLGRVGSLFLANAPLVPLILLPMLTALTLDATAWGVILRRIGWRVPVRRLLVTRLATEALYLAAPGGPVAAEGMKVLLLGRLGVPAPDAVASVAVKKSVLLGAHAIYLLLALAAGGPWLLAPAALLLACGCLGLLSLLGRARMAGRLHRLLSRVPIAPLRRWLDARARRFAEIDARCAPVVASPATILRAVLPLTIGWLMESIETWLILRVIGIGAPLTQALAVEATVSLVRTATMFAPGALGFQDATYAALFHDPVFAVCKRAKELFWITVGLGVLAASRARRWSFRARPGILPG